MIVTSFTHQGRVRGNNEDCLHVDEMKGLFVVCDGMGGAAGGEIASAMTCEIVAREFAMLPALEVYRHASPESATTTKAIGLTGAITTANREVLARSKREKDLKGMGTTIVAALLTKPAGTDGASVVVAHAGDSRAYLLRRVRPSNPAPAAGWTTDPVALAAPVEANLHQITTDHSIGNAMLKAGYTQDEVNLSAHAHSITTAVGVEERFDAEVNVYTLRPGDVLLLCSDGLSNELTAEQIAQALLEPDAADRLLDAALAHGGKDNISGIVVRT